MRDDHDKEQPNKRNNYYKNVYNHCKGKLNMTKITLDRDAARNMKGKAKTNTHLKNSKKL